MLQSSIQARVFIILLSVLFSLTLAEVLIRLFYIFPDYDYPKGMYKPDELLQFSLTSNFKGKVVKHEFWAAVDTNSLGLRDHEYTEKKPNEVRILALGDSFTWGAYGTQMPETFVKLLEKKLNETDKGRTYQVINAGVPAYSTYQELLYLTNRGYKLKPDVVMVNFFVGNDFLENTQFGSLTVHDGTLVTNSFRLKISEQLRTFLLEHFQSYRLAERVFLRFFGDFVETKLRGRMIREDYQTDLFTIPPNQTITYQIEKTLALLSSLKKYCEDHGMKFVLVVIPFNYQVDNRLKQLFIKSYFHPGQTVDIEFPQKKLNNWAQQTETPMVDLLPQMKKTNKNNDYYWKYNPHFNGAGNQITAEIIYNYLTAPGGPLPLQTP